MKQTLYDWQIPLWQKFIQQRQEDRLAHAILLSGVKGLGKKKFSQQLIASILCHSIQQDGHGCGTCHSCQLLAANTHPDHADIMPEQLGKQIKIDQIRALKDKQQLTAHVAQWKTVLISPADAMTTSASNSLLKLLEEPQKNTILILITAHIENLPITIKSRCQSFHMAVPYRQHAIDFIKSHSTDITDAALNNVLELNKGAPLAVLSMLNNQGLAQYQKIEHDVNQLLLDNVNPITLASEWQQYDFIELMHQIQLMIKNRLIDKLSHNESTITDKKYWAIFDCITDTLKLGLLKNNLNKVLLIESFIVSIMQLSEK